MTAHLSYLDRENFGRISLELSEIELLAALDQQYALMSDVRSVKFHGALYNDSVTNASLAELLARWLRLHGIREVLTLPGSQLAMKCALNNIAVIREGFAERNYAYNRATRQLSLVSRGEKYAVIDDCDAAIAHARMLIERRVVNAYLGRPGREGADIRRRLVGLEVGFRSYPCYRAACGVSHTMGEELLSRRWGPFAEITRWPDARGQIHVMAGHGRA